MLKFSDSVYDDLLEIFSIDKAEDDRLLSDESANIFIETEVYKKITRKGRFLLVGRKGAGKTGLILGYKSRQENQKKHLNSEYITFDDFPFVATMSFFIGDFDEAIDKADIGTIGDDNIRGELKDLIGPAYAFKYAWTNCLLYFCIYIACDKLLSDELVAGDEKKILISCMRDIEKKFPFLDCRLSNHVGMFYGFLTELVGVMLKSLGEVIKNHNSDAQTSLSDEASLIAVLVAKSIDIANEDIRASNKELKRAIPVIQSELHQLSKTVLISLDKFDDFLFDVYQKMAKSQVALYVERQRFFMSVIEGLILAVRDIKLKDGFDWIGTLLTIPKDKYMELELRENSHILRNHVVSLDWEAGELLKLVKARFNHVMLKSLNDARWDDVFDSPIQHLRVAAVKEDPFLYVLRHSLWRPREVLVYFSEVFRFMQRSHNGAPLSDLMIAAVREMQRHIIENEIIVEFSKELPDLRSALRKLEVKQLSAVMPYHDFAAKLSGVRLSSTIFKTHDVATRLYYLGVIGVRKILTAPRYGRNGSVRQNNVNVAYEFAYNCDDTEPFVDENVQVCFHPLFFEYLRIRGPIDYVVNQLEWGMFKPPNWMDDGDDNED